MTPALQIVDHPSPNCGDRRGGAVPDMVVLHYTAMASTGESLARLCDPAFEVSCHYLIDPGGTVLRLVPEELRAWHAGAGRWGAVTDVNSHSIGIELQNRGDHPYAEPQMRALERLLAGIMARWSIPPERVIGHSDMAPARKSDPGPRFDWGRLALGGLSVWPDRGAAPATGSGADRAPAGDPVAELGAACGAPVRFRAGAVGFGYDPDLSDALLLRGFRLRFRPWAGGPVDATDTALITDLARRWPVAGPGAVDGGGPGA